MCLDPRSSFTCRVGRRCGYRRLVPARRPYTITDVTHGAVYLVAEHRNTDTLPLLVIRPLPALLDPSPLSTVMIW